MQPSDVDMKKREARIKNLKEKGLSPVTDSLSILAVKGLLQTPKISDMKGGSRQRTPETAKGNLDDLIESAYFHHEIISRLSPLFVESMMGSLKSWLEI